MPRTSPRHAPRQNLPALLNERRQNLRLLVINEIGLIHAEPANLLLAHEIPLPALRWSARPSSAWTSGPAARSRGPHPSRRGAVRLLLWCVFFCHSILLTNFPSIRTPVGVIGAGLRPAPVTRNRLPPTPSARTARSA